MANYTKKKIAELQARAKELGIVTRSNMGGPTLEGKIALVEGGTPLDQVNPAPRGSKKAGGVAAPKAPAAAKAPQTSKPVSSKKVQVYNLYAADGNELSFSVMAEGATPQEAAQAATEKGDIAPETPLIAVPLEYVQRPVSVKRIEQPPIFEAVIVEVAKAAPAPKADPAPTPATPAAPKPAAPAAGSARKTGSARKAAAAPATPAPVPAGAPPLPPAPGAVDDNPFAT